MGRRGWCSSCCKLPFGTAVAFVVTQSGLAVCCLSRDAVLQVLEGAGAGFEITRQCVKLIYLPVVFTSLVDTLGFSLALFFAVMGISRGGCGGPKAEPETWPHLFCQRILTRPCIAGGMELLSKFAFVLQLLLSYALLIPYLSTDFLAAICDGGPRAQQEAQELSAALQSPGRGGHALMANLDVGRYCAGAAGLDGAALSLFAGSAFAALGQGGLMACMTELMDVACQAAHATVQDRSAAKRCAQSPVPCLKGASLRPPFEGCSPESPSCKVRLPPVLSPVLLKAQGAASAQASTPKSGAGGGGAAAATPDTLRTYFNGSPLVVEF